MSSDRIYKALSLLRLASTVLFGVLCIGCVVLWIRSYWYVDGGMFSTLPNQHVAFHGGSGRMCVWFEHSPANQWFRWRARPNTDGASPDDPDRAPVFDLALFWPTMTRLYVAHWFLAVVTALITLAPWCPRRFRSRDLLVAMAAVSMVIGLIAWIDRTF